MTLSLYLGGVIVTPATTPALKFVRCPPLGDSPCTTAFSRPAPPAGDFIASFHCCTLLTASSNFVVAPISSVVVLGFLVFVPAIHGCLRSLYAETRKLGSFWKHWRRKSRTAGEAPSGRGGCSSFTIRKRAGMGSSLWYGGRPSSNSMTVQPTLLRYKPTHREIGTKYLKLGSLQSIRLLQAPLLSDASKSREILQ